MKNTVFVATKDGLPYDALTWESFETLCLQLSFKKYKEISRKYLNQGNKQEGIDIYVKDAATKRYITIQCKKREKFTAGDLRAAVQKFLSGEFSKTSQEFIIATSCEISGKTLQQEIQKAEKLLEKKKIKLTLWDGKGLNLLLKDYPQIVYDAFLSTDVVERFNGSIALKQLLPEKPLPAKISYPKPSIYIERRTYTLEDAPEVERVFWKNNNYYATTIQRIEKQLNEVRKPSKILLLSGAGFGKSSELENIANYFSEESQNLFPIKIELRNYVNEKIEDLVEQKCADWRNIRPENVLVILDGLDEIEDSRMTDFLRKLNQFSTSQTFSSVNMVLSSRTNFYDRDSISTSLKDFAILLLDGLNLKEVKTFSKEILIKDSDTFWNLISQRKFDDLVLHPFYFILLVEIYNEKGMKGFPSSRIEIFEKLIELRIEKEKTKFCLKFPNINADMPLIKSLVTKAAFSMEQLGKNIVKDEELKELFPEVKDRELLKYFFLINKGVSKDLSWQFDHNNFQEYLASKVLKTRKFEEIKNLIAFKPHYNRVKPKWINTLSFLFSIENNTTERFKMLYDWIVTNSPEILIRFDKDKLTPNSRDEIFKEIYNSYKTKQLFIRSEYFSLSELANFSTKNKAWVEFLISEINDSSPDDVLYSLLSLLECTDNLYTLENSIESALFRIIKSKNYEPPHQRNAISCLTTLNLGNKNLLIRIIKQCPNVDNYEVRNVVYRLINQLGLEEEYINFCLSGIQIIADKTRNVTHIGAGLELEKAILGSSKTEIILKVFDYIFNNSDILGYDASVGQYQFNNEFIEKLMGLCATIYKKDSSVYNLVTKLFLLIADKHYLREYPAVLNFYSETNTQLLLTKELLDNGTLDSLYVDEYYRTLNWESLDFIAKQYKYGKVTENKIWNIIHSLNRKETKTIYTRFYNHVKRISNGKIKYHKATRYSWDEIAQKQDIKNQKLILSKVKFFREVETFFKKLGKNDLTWENITEFRHKNRTAEAVHENRIVIDFLRDFANHKKCNLTHIKKIYSPQKNWEWYIRNQAIRKLESGKPLINELEKYIVNWCLKQIQSANFQSAVYKKEGANPNDFTYKRIEHDLAFFLQKLDLMYPKETMLEMFNMDWSGIKRHENNKEILSDVLIKKINDNDAISDSILKNIENGIKVRPVLSTHIRLCKELEIGKSLKYLFIELKGDTIDVYDKVECAEVFLLLGGEKENLEELTPTEYQKEINYWEWYLLNHLVSYNPAKAEIVLLKIMTDPLMREEDRDSAAEKLVTLGRIEGLAFLHSWVTSHNKPPRWHQTSKYLFKNLPLKPATDIFMKLIEYSYTSFEVKDVMFPGAVDIGILGITSLGTISEENLLYVEEKLEAFIKKMKKKYPKVTYLYNQIDNIKKEYYLLNEEATIKETKMINDTIDFLQIS